MQFAKEDLVGGKHVIWSKEAMSVLTKNSEFWELGYSIVVCSSPTFEMEMSVILGLGNGVLKLYIL